MSRLPKKKQKSEEKPPSADDILKLPDWHDENKIYNYVEVPKQVDGQKKIFPFKIWLENDELKYNMDKTLILPPDTTMSYEMFSQILEQQKIPEVSIKKLFVAIRNRISKYVFVHEDIHFTNATLKILMSYFLDVFSTVPYTDLFSPEPGSGKTTFMEAMTYSSYHGIVYTNMKGASLYRTMKSVSCTLGIDEVDKIKKDQNMDILAVVNSSNKKGSKVPRFNIEKDIVEYYDAFGSKYFTRTANMPDNAIISRSDPIPMTENRGRKDLKKYPLPKHFGDLRDQAYLLRWQIMEKVEQTYNELISEGILKDRNGDIYLPMLTIAKLVGEVYVNNGMKVGEVSKKIKVNVFENVLEYAKKQWKKNSLKSKDIEKEILIRVLYNNKLFRGDVKIVDILKEFNEKLEELEMLPYNREGVTVYYKSRKVINLLNSLRFERSIKKAQNNVHYNINNEILIDNCLLYNIDLGEVSEESEDSQHISENLFAFIPSESSLTSLTSLNDNSFINDPKSTRLKSDLSRIKQNKKEIILTIIRRFSLNDALVQKENVIIQAFAEGIAKDVSDKLITLLFQEGKIYEPRPGQIKLMEEI